MADADGEQVNVPVFKSSHIYKKDGDILTETRQRVLNGDPNESIRIVRCINNDMMEIIVGSKGTEKAHLHNIPQQSKHAQIS